jgi:cyanophycin synthetase
VPRIQAEALRAAGVGEAAISIIPDEQEAIEAALRMGQTGDLLLIFADALARSWKQITKFKSSGTAAGHVAQSAATVESITPAPLQSNGANGAIEAGTNNGMHHYFSAATAAEPVATLGLEGIIRDERGLRMAPASDD